MIKIFSMNEFSKKTLKKLNSQLFCTINNKYKYNKINK